MGKSTDQVAAIEKIVCCLFQFSRGGAGCALQGYPGKHEGQSKGRRNKGRMTATAFVVRVFLFVFDGKAGQGSISKFMTS